MTESKKTEIKTLIGVLNDYFQQAIPLCTDEEHQNALKNISISFWDEVRNKQGSLTYDFTKKRITEASPRKENDLSYIAWLAGLLKPLNEAEIQEKLLDKLGKDKTRIVALGLDTNLIYNRFFHSTIATLFKKVNQRFPGLLLLSRGSNDEMSYKTSLVYKSEHTDRDWWNNFLKYLENNVLARKLLLDMPRMNLDEMERRLSRLPSRQGRLGHKGLHEFRILTREALAICSMPVHLYYMKEMHSKETIEFPDAVYDSLIRYELLFFRNNTNAKVLFFTADKNQAQAAKNEGLKTTYVAPPTSIFPLLGDNGPPVSINNLAAVIRELIWYSPIVEVSIPGLKGAVGTLYISFSWHRKMVQDFTEGIIKYGISKPDGSLGIIDTASLGSRD